MKNKKLRTSTSWEKRFDQVYGRPDDPTYFIDDEQRSLVKDFIKSLLKETKEKSVREERERWINQPFNKHDEEIRKEAVRKTIEKIENALWGKGVTNRYSISEKDWNKLKVSAE